jgi:tRNA (guanine37-N1)-methyltransferase
VTQALVRFDVVTLFPELIQAWASSGVCGRAVSRGLVDLALCNPRQFTSDVHQTVDDRPYGGGPGMVMMAEPLRDAVRACQSGALEAGWVVGPVVLFSPVGRPLRQDWVEAAVGSVRDGHARCQWTLICGRYEGIDQRFIDQFVDEEISLGDFVLSGGEIPAMALMDALTRRLPGVLGDDDSSVQDSFMAGLLDHPHYTRPETFEGQNVPEVLLSGHHGKISDWRAAQAFRMTQLKRPDLLDEKLVPSGQSGEPTTSPSAAQEKKTP